ncbi:MAG: hypothetical protein JRI25_12425 [Deltaproteobacteria bacterium]|nr:hypothetical protein [Deltaproteobacteria bacterium]
MQKRWLLVLVLSGCPTPDDCFEDLPIVEIGTGDDAFEPLEDGAPLTMVHGPQGGWHLLVSSRVSHTTESVDIGLTVTDVPSSVEVSKGLYEVFLGVEDECIGTFSGMYAFLGVAGLAEGQLNTPPELLAGHELLVEMAIEDSEGRATEAGKTVIAALDPMDVPD